MATPARNWTDPEVRKEALDASHFRKLVNDHRSLGAFLTNPSIPDDYLKWTNVDKLAYFCLLESSGDRVGVATAFKLSYKREAEKRADLRNAEENRRAISESFAELQKILQKFEPLIRSRWTKKHKAARDKVPQGADPNCARSHRPDVRHLIFGPWTKERQSPYKARDFLFPHINCEDLGEGHTFLRLLHARVGMNRPPSLWLT